MSVLESAPQPAAVRRSKVSRRLPLLVGLLSFLVSAAGCGGASDAPERVLVTGAVTLDGQPVEQGRITFIDADLKRDPDQVEIKQGKYEVQATLGKRRVEINVAKPSATLKDQEGTVELEEVVAPQFNRESTLTAEISAENTVHDFKVESRK